MDGVSEGTELTDGTAEGISFVEGAGDKDGILEGKEERVGAAELSVITVVDSLGALDGFLVTLIGTVETDGVREGASVS